jgi:hypothetical protein
MTRSVRQWSLFRPKGLASIATVALVEEVLFAVCAALRVNAANFNVMLLASVAACVMASLVWSVSRRMSCYHGAFVDEQTNWIRYSKNVSMAAVLLFAMVCAVLLLSIPGQQYRVPR